MAVFGIFRVVSDFAFEGLRLVCLQHFNGAKFAVVAVMGPSSMRLLKAPALSTAALEKEQQQASMRAIMCLRLLLLSSVVGSAGNGCADRCASFRRSSDQDRTRVPPVLAPLPSALPT